VYTADNINQKVSDIDLSSWIGGMYTIRIIDISGDIHQSKFVKL